MSDSDDRYRLQCALAVESRTERRIVDDPTWQRGMLWGVPRPGHPEGQVINHVRDVLENVDRFAPSNDPFTRSRLRLIALLHDACKRDTRSAGPHHGVLARKLAERFTDDPDVLDVIELHDEAYACWRLIDRRRVAGAHARADALIETVERCLDLYLLFHRCDTMTVGKERDALDWFETFVGIGSHATGLPLP